VRFPVLLLCAAAMASVPTGPEPGQRIPDFRLQDQKGAYQTLQSIMGPKGAMLVFYRSADW
jgi:peroxiredoxin